MGIGIDGVAHNMARLKHGGQLLSVANEYGSDTDDWLDLSTGISPLSYSVGDIPAAVWRELPQVKQEFINIAKTYYHARELIVGNGSQIWIQLLPQLWNIQTAALTSVYIPEVGYKEHQKAWSDNGFKVQLYRDLPQPEMLEKRSIIVVINPNNPRGNLYSPDELVELWRRQKQLGGWLIVDEAFIDVYPKEYSLIHRAHEDGLFVLRSVGKFFGLAGIRIGFISCHKHWHKLLSELNGCWQVNGPALYVMEKAFRDFAWQTKQREALKLLSKNLLEILAEFFDPLEIMSTPLFVTIKCNQADRLYQHLCLDKIYIRLCDEENRLRFGIPKLEDSLRLKNSLTSFFKDKI